MTIKSRKFTKGIRLKGTQDPATLDGEIRNDEDVKRLKVHLESDGTDPAGEREIVTSDQTQELTNKIIDGNENTITNVSADAIGNLVEDLTVPQTDHDSIPSALAVQDYVENTAAASSSDLIYHMSDKSTHGVSSDIVGESDTQTLTNKTIDSASNTMTVNADEATVSNLETDNFKAGVVDTDGTLAADSDTRIPSQKAVKTYVDSATSGIVSDASAVTYTQDDPSNWQQTHTNVAEPLDELASRASTVESQFNDHLYTTGDKHNSEEIVYDNTTSGMAANNVKDALDELKGDIGSGAAVDITYDDTVTGLGATVQAAIDQLDQNIAGAGNDVQATNSYYVCENSGDDLNPGTLLRPFATIQKAIDEVIASGVGGGSSVINVDYGFYTENLQLAGAYNTIIIGKGMTDTQNCWIQGSVELTNSENIKFKNFRIEQASVAPTITIGLSSPSGLIDSGGRHQFESCVINNNQAGQTVLRLNDGTSDFNVFRECTFVGAIDLTPSTNLGASVSFIECSSEGAPITVDNCILSAVDCYSLGHITHNSGIIALKDIHSMERSGSSCLDSTASFSASNVVYLEDVSTYNLLTNDYGAINIAACGYILNACSRDPLVDTITGLRLTLGQRSQDIAYDNSDSGLTATDVKSAIDEVKTLASGGGGGGSQVYIGSSKINENQSLTQQSPFNIPNATVTFTSDGSPLEISLITDGGTAGLESFVGITKVSPSQTSMFIYLYENVTTGKGIIKLEGYSNLEWSQGVSCIKFYVLNPPVGSVTYNLKYAVAGASNFGSLTNCRIMAKTL
jgi:hypothetical protein